MNAAGRGCLYPGCDKFWAGVLGFKTTPKTATKRLTRTHTHKRTPFSYPRLATASASRPFAGVGLQVLPLSESSL